MSKRPVLAILIAFTLTATMASSLAAASASPGEVIATNSVGHSDDWVVYDRSTCTFTPTDDHPDDYVSVLRVATEPTKVAYTPEEAYEDFLIKQNASVRQRAEDTGIDLLYLDNEYPDKQKPLEVADAVVLANPAVVLSMNIYEDLQPTVVGKYNDACIPTVILDLPRLDNTVFFGVTQSEMGNVSGDYAVTQIEARGWPLADVWPVSCNDPDQGTLPGSPFDRVTFFQDTLREQLPEIPEDHYFILNCTVQQGSEDSRIQMTDWLTAHPDAQYVISNAITDTHALGMQRALETAGYGDSGNAMVLGINADTAALELIAAGDPIFVGTVSQSPETRGDFLIPLAMDIAEGLPVPTEVLMPPVVINADNVGGS